VNEDRKRFDPASCSVAATLAVVGERWTLLVLREAFYGLRRYDDFVEAIGCARNILSDRLRKLVDQDIIRRSSYREEGQRERFEYRLTDRGLDLFPVLMALMQWGDRWLAGKRGPSVVVEHRDCRQPVRVQLRCAAGHGPLSARETAPVPGPGARRSRPARDRRRRSGSRARR
jgi:DNA-binding HxlR family transcriptional regulator